MELQVLSDKPQHYADCCLSLSNAFLDCLIHVLQSIVKQGLVLSIGSGTGLLEAHLIRHLEETQIQGLHVEAVEVRSKSSYLNAYLPEELTHTVEGTWAVCPRAEVASALLFVYPRTVTLVRSYIEMCVKPTSSVNLVIWLGPRMDWEDYLPVLHLPGFKPAKTIHQRLSLSEYEMMAVLERER